MADPSNEKPLPEVLSTTGSADTPNETFARPAGWTYRRFSIGPVTLPMYASPPAQLLVIALVCFLCPGMFNALNGMGGGGQVDAHASDLANVALYSTFSVVGESFPCWQKNTP